MYESFYGLEQHPFSLTPDSDFLFLNENFQESLDQLTYAANRREAFSVLIGDVGTGKTTLCWALLLRMRMPKNIRTALILNPLLDIDDLLRAIIQDFRIKPSQRRAPWLSQPVPEADGLQDASWLDGFTRRQLIDELNRFLLEGAKDDVRSILVIDEAQNLSLECLEQLRVLSNLETSKHKLLQIVFSGQLELDQKLNFPQLRQLKQRISVRCSLQPLSKKDMDRYINHRLWKAGNKRSHLFSERALKNIFKHSRGYPRLINLICDRALMAGYNQRSPTITNEMVNTAINNLAIGEIPATFRLFPFLVRLAAVGIVSLMIFWGMAYYIRSRNIDIRFMGYQETIRPASASTDITESEKRLELPNPVEVQPPIPALPASTSPPVTGFSLQAHSLQDQQQAEKAVADLQQKGYPAYHRSIANSDGARWHVVYLGPFNELEKAWDMAETVLEREQLKTILRSHSPSETP